jgi:2-amino-4-hydroxy-6-hydroxymethyldihydropteridine diphosphokinase
MPHRAFIGIGTNLGDRAAHYCDAVRRIRALPDTVVVRQSSVYETEPVGKIQGSFLNGVIAIDTQLGATALLRQLLAIEHQMGRQRSPGRARGEAPPEPRTIDLDLLFFDDAVLDSGELTVPHPRLHERRFVLIPMAEIAPTFIHPRFNQTMSQLLARLAPTHQVTLARGELFFAQAPREEVPLK